MRVSCGWKMHRIGVPTIHLRDSQSRCATFSPLVERSEAVIQAKVNQAAKIVEETQRGKAPTRS